MEPCSVFDIGEIVDAIALSLDNADLARCLRVSRKCHAAFAAHLYRKLSTFTTLYVARARSPADTFKRYGCLVRDLTVVHPFDMSAIHHHITNLEHLKLAFRSYGAFFSDFLPYGYAPQSLLAEGICQDTNWEVFCRYAGVVFDENPGLLSFETDSCGDDGNDLPVFEQIFLRPPSRLVCLTNLSLHNYCYGTRTILDLLAHYPRLKQVTIRFVGCIPINHQPDQFLPCYQLESASIGHDVPHQDLALFNVTLWERCPRLQSLHITGITATTMTMMIHRQFGALFPPTSNIVENVDSSINFVLGRLSTAIQSFSANGWGIGESTLGTFLSPERSSNLRILSLERCTARIPSSVIQSLLTSCPSLQELKVGASTMNNATTTTLSVQDIVYHGPWVCKGLTRLMIPITGLSSEGSHDHPKRHGLERAVYRQLRQMHQLRIMHVGRNCALTRFGRHDNASRLHGTLSFSLANGLDELSTLSHLEEVDLSCVEHGVALPEVQWMAQHWPRWRYMGGVEFESDAKSWLQQNKAGFLFV